MMSTLSALSLDGLSPSRVCSGKVRETCTVDGLFVMVTTDRISAFDRILPISVPRKGCVLNLLSAHFMRETASVVPNWLLRVPDSRACVGLPCVPFAVEIIVRGHLSGEAWRQYRAGRRRFLKRSLPEGLREHAPLTPPIITPTTKATGGRDVMIDSENVLRKELGHERYAIVTAHAQTLFVWGRRYAERRGLLLADAKYEFGTYKHGVYLIDELHTPDSARYFCSADYEAAMQSGHTPTHLSKEFVRQWLIRQGFRGENRKKFPTFTSDFVRSIQERYLTVYHRLMGQSLPAAQPRESLEDNILSNIAKAIRTMKAAGLPP